MGSLPGFTSISAGVTSLSKISATSLSKGWKLNPEKEVSHPPPVLGVPEASGREV